MDHNGPSTSQGKGGGSDAGGASRNERQTVRVTVTETTPLLPQQGRSKSDLRRGSAMFDLSHVPTAEIPLLKDADGGHGHSIGGGSTGSAMFNLSNTIIGAGIMGLPAILKALGIPLGLLTLVLLGALSEYSLQRLLRCTIIAKAWSFGDLMAATYGRMGRNLLRACIIVHNIGILMVYLLIIGDVFCGSNSGGQHYPGLLEEWAGGSTWWNTRPVVLLASVGVVVAPLVSLSHIDSLQFTSGISIFLAIVFVVITIFVTLWNVVHGSIDWSGLRWLPPGIGFPLDIWQLFSVIPTIATAFTCHYNLHPVLVELTPPREEKLKTAVRGTLVLCTSVYCVTALFGYMLFGDSTYPDVLANFDKDLNIPYSEFLDDVVRLFYALHLMLVFPVIHFSLRASLDAVIFPRAAPLAEDKPRFFLITALLLTAILVLSLVVPNVQFAFQFVGAAGAATIAFTLPGLIALSDEAGASTASRFQTGMAILLLGFGVAVTVTGLTSNVHSLFVKS